MTAVFTALSIPLLVPFLEILFERTELVTQAPENLSSIDNISLYFSYLISQMILNEGKEMALVYVCGGILSVFFMKNLFRYLSLFFMAPVRNGIVRDIREQLFSKISLYVIFSD